VYVGITGWEPVRALGSCSTDTFSRLGPLPLVDGDVLTGRPDARAPIGGFLRPTSVAAGPLRALRATVASGPEWEEVRATHWTVTAVARSGIRLTGERSAGEWIDLPSNPLVPGAIQATPDGDLVIIGPDGGVTGGYPVVGVVASVDLDRLSLLRPGERLRFSECDSVAAATAWQEQEQARRRSWVHPDGLR
jgi:allophanate hydrolase subunit 2